MKNKFYEMKKRYYWRKFTKAQINLYSGKWKYNKAFKRAHKYFKKIIILEIKGAKK